MAKTVTVDEVAQHNSEKDCWVIIKGKAYDVTKYLDDHPGGVEIITDLAGMDSSEDFDDVGHSEDAYKMLDDYYVGDVAGSTVEVSPARQPATSQPVKSQPVKSSTPQATPKPKSEDNTSTLLIGAAAVAVLAFFFLRKKK